MKFIQIPIVILKTRSGFNAFSPSVHGCAASDKSIDKVLKRMKSALKFHLEGESLFSKSSKSKTEKVLIKAFKDYGSEAVYTSVRVAA